MKIIPNWITNSTHYTELCYLDDIAHGRVMNLDPHELKIKIEQDLVLLATLKKYYKKGFLEFKEGISIDLDDLKLLTEMREENENNERKSKSNQK